MKRRTEGEIKAYVDGYNACYNQFCECLKGRKSVWQAVKKMELFVTAVNSTVEVADTPQTDCYMCKWMGDRDVCGRCRNRNLFAVADTPQTESTGSPIGDYRDGVGAWSDCPRK